MMMCEKCWDDAYIIVQNEGGTQTEVYLRLLVERKGRPCSKEEDIVL